MENTFKINGIAVDDEIIGKKIEMEELKEEYLNGNNSVAYALVGLPKTGKTSFAKNIFKNKDEKILFIQCDLKMFKDYYGIWKNISTKIKRYIDNNFNKDDLYNSFIDSLYCLSGISNDMEWADFILYVEDVFVGLEELDVKIIFLFESFDFADKLFDDIQMFQVFRDVLSIYSNVSSLVISRTPLHRYKNGQASGFYNIFKIINFGAFNENEMNEFTAKLLHYDISLSDEQINKLDYYSGGLPYLVSIFGHYIIEDYSKGGSIDIDNILKEHSKIINDYYRDCLKYFKDSDYLKYILPFSIGPKIGINSQIKEDIINLKYLYETEEEYIVLSKYFRNFLTSDLLEGISSWESIIGTEKRLKYLVKREYTRIVKKFHIFGEDEESILIGIMSNCDIRAFARYDGYILNNLENYSQVSNYLDVMSIGDVIKIIKNCWMDIFSEYFNNDSFDKWNSAFQLCERARNPFAHGHEEFLNESETNITNQYCIKILELLSDDNVFKIIVDDDYLAAARFFEDNSSDETNLTNDNRSSNSNSSDYFEPDQDFIEQEADFIIEIIKNTVTKTNIKGYVQYNNKKYQAVIPKNHCTLELLGKSVGDVIRVRTTKINFGQYEVLPIE
ncbi:MAG: ATP-binding protein [Lachnospiraceae bacterium]|nr:ATP-binding protein [Lachnospiraceae bacterium]